MKKLLLILLCLPMIGFGQLTTGFYQDFGYFHKTTDGGQTWTEQNTNNQQSTTINHVSFISNTTGFYQDFGYFYKTTDGGQTWTEQNTNNQQSTTINHVSFISENITSISNIPIPSNRKLEKVIDVLGRETKPQENTPFIEIYDDGTVEKRIVIE